MSVQPIVNLPFKYIDGLQLGYATTTTFTVGSGRCRDSLNNMDLVLASTTTLTGSNGVNGLDTGTIAADTWYYVFVIGDSFNFQPTATIYSLSSTTPYLPTGYDTFRRNGAFLTNASSQVTKFVQVGTNNQREYFWDIDTTGAIVLSAGAATTLTAVDCSGLMPATSTVVNLHANYVPQAAGNTFKLRTTGSSIAAGSLVRSYVGQVTAVAFNNDVHMNTNSSQSIDYVVANAGDALSLYVTGFVDYV